MQHQSAAITGKMLKTTSVLLLVAALVTVNTAEEAKKDNTTDRAAFKRAYEKECSSSYSVTCLKLDVVQWIDKLNDNADYNVLPGVTVVRDGQPVEKSNEVVAEIARAFPNDPESRLDAYLVKKVTGYLGSHSIKLNLFDSKAVQEEFTGREKGGFGGGKGGKKGGGLGMLMMAAAMMKGTLMTVAMGALAAIAGKALMTGMISLLLSGIIGLKSLTSKGHSSVVEVHAKPVHSTHHSYDEHGGYGHSSYGRSFEEPLPAGLQPGYKPY